MSMTAYYSVHGHPFIDLEPHLDLSRMPIIADEIAAFLTRRRVFDIVSFTSQQEIHPSEQFEFDPTETGGTKHTITGVGPEGRIMFSSFYQPVVALYGVRLRDMDRLKPFGLEDLEREECNEDTEHAAEVPHTMEFLRSLPLKGLGRVTIYHSAPGMRVPAHRDNIEHPGFNSQFIYLNPLKKPFFVLDGQGEKHYIDTRAAIFNPNDFHGMDVCWRSCFSIRVQGFWNHHIKEQVGLGEEYFGGRS